MIFKGLPLQPVSLFVFLFITILLFDDNLQISLSTFVKTNQQPNA